MNYESSQTFSWLVKEGGFHEKNKIIQLLTLIRAPLHLSLLFKVLNNLPSILSIAERIYQLDEELFPFIDFATVNEACDQLLGKAHLLSGNAALFELFQRPGQSLEYQLHGILKSHLLYSCLCFQPKRKNGRPIYNHLLAQVLLASQLLDDNRDRSDDYNLFLSVRKLAELKFESELLALPEKPLPPQDYLAVTHNAPANSHTRKAGLILQHAYKGRRFRKAHQAGNKRDTGRRITSTNVEDYESIEELFVGQEKNDHNLLTKRRARQYARHGGSAAEFQGGKAEVPVSLPDERSYSGPTLRELAFQGKQRSNQGAMKNQFIPLGWNELNEYDISILLKYLTGDPTVGVETTDPALRDYLGLSFWLSSPLEKVLGLKKFSGDPIHCPDEGIYLRGDRTLVAKIYSPGPPLETARKKISKLAIPVRQFSHIPLPVIAHTASLVRSCHTSMAGEEQVSRKELSEDRTDFIRRRLRENLNRLNKSFGTRLSLGRISHFWLHKLGMEHDEDLPSAMLFFGYNEKYSVARLHYTCAPVRRMEAAYRRICSEMLRNLGFNETFPDDFLVNEDIHLGTPLCPTPEAVRNLVKSLQNAVEQSRPTKKNLTHIKNFHNHYVVYTACLIAFATSYRAVRDPSLSEPDIDFESGLGVISDKDDDTFYHSRFVWIADVCRQQIIHYRRHLQRLYELFGLQVPAIFYLFNRTDRQGSPLKLFFLPRNNTSIKLLRPGLLEKLLSDLHGYNLPANTHRHYLKYQLLESGCRPDIIEAFLGHWEQGQEPWSRFSNLHPREFCHQLDHHLTPILERDGWKAIEGLTP